MITAPRTDPRYHTKRWQRLRLAVLRRDLYRCWEKDKRTGKPCEANANVADHKVPVYVGMPDSLFYDPENLRASCRTHNIARGFAALLDDGDQVKPLPLRPTVRWGR